MKKVKNYLKSIPKEKLIILICTIMAVIAIAASIILFASAKSDKKENENTLNTDDVGYNNAQSTVQEPNSLEYQSLGNGTCVVVGIGTFCEEELEIPQKNHLGETVVGIASGAFEGCEELTSIYIPSTVTNLGESIFVGCSSLALISVDRSNAKFSSVGGILFSKNKTTLICYPASRVGSSYLLNPNVTNIANDAFSGVRYLSRINYEGSTEEFGEITVGEGNRIFNSLPITCNYSPSK